jgi:exportin-1
MEEALQRLLSTTEEFDTALLDQVVAAAYDPVNPQRAAANTVLMTLQENPDLWTKADGILERANNPQSRFFGLQILDDAIRTR